MSASLAPNALYMLPDIMNLSTLIM